MTTTILVIDDDPDILKVLKANLELHQFNTLTATSWAEGSKIIMDVTPDLLILDLMLPDKDGIDICKTVRAQYQGMPIIMLTAKDKISDKVTGLESGADDYVVKPFETIELIARIKACLRRIVPEMKESHVTIGNLHIDYKRRIVKIDGMEVLLTPKEYDLLCLLSSRRGSVISREEIKTELWRESNIYTWSRVIDVHIQHLRQKIEKNPSDPEYILTVSGVGYRFKQ
ncbi:MAG: response regulator transcription factor [Dissulfurispiraceae bacterium]|jgi:DNA-binding response OmpR family regulator|nr:response regulator transcription factor [Dissulfurispiraceae bacterium]